MTAPLSAGDPVRVLSAEDPAQRILGRDPGGKHSPQALRSEHSDPPRRDLDQHLALAILKQQSTIDSGLKGAIELLALT